MKTRNPAPDPRRGFFDAQAPTWDRTGPDPAATLARLRALDGRLGLRAGQSVLEVGCGTGQITGWLVDKVRPGRVVAVDFAPAMLEQARARGVAAEFRLLDICVEEPARERFDRVFCFSAFPHFRDPQAALRQMGRYLADCGELIVLHLSGSAELNAFHASLSGPVNQDRLPPAPEWPGLLAATGWEALVLEDRPELFLLRARRRPASPAPAG